MFSLLNRISWLIFIVPAITIYLIDDDFLIGCIIILFIKFLILSGDYIKKTIDEHDKNLEDKIIARLSKNNNLNLKENLQELDLKNENTIKTEEFIEEKAYITKNELIENTNFSKIERLKDEIGEIKQQDEEEEYEEEEDEEPSKIYIFLSEFFAENLLAKIGGILLTLGILFLMSLVYSIVGPVAKIVIGISVGFIVYFIGTLLVKKGLDTEGIILIGTGILINYIVILSGKYIIGDDGILSSSTTFIFLILNTVFSTLSAYIYKSKNLLLFSIFIAYLVPFLVGSTGSKYSYIIVIGYSIILSIGTLIISNFKNNLKEFDTSMILFYFTIILGNLLVLASPISDSIGFIVKMIGFNIITFSSIYIAYKNNFKNHIFPIFSISYLFLGLIIIFGTISLSGAFSSFFVLISYLIGILGLLLASVFFIIGGIGAGILYFLFIPILFILGLLLTGNLFAGIFLIPFFLIIYLFSFIFISKAIVGALFKYVFFIIIGRFLSISNIYFKISLDLDIYGFISIIITSFIFLISTYYLSSKKDLTYLYSIGTLASILIFLPVIQITGEFYILSAISIVLFGIINYISPFINSNLVKNDSRNLVLGNIFGVLFIGGNLFRFGNEYFPGMTLGIAFLVLAILYFIGGFILFNKFENEDSSNKESNLNFIYTFLAIAISLFSISIALIFSKLPIVIALIWLLQSSIVIFFANKLASTKIYTAGIILFVIGLAKYFSIGFENNLIYSDLITIFFIGVSLFLNIIFIKKSNEESVVVIKILHIIGIIMIFFSLLEIFKNNVNHLIFSAIFLAGLHIIYNLLKDKFVKIALLGGFSIFFFLHLGETGYPEIYMYNYITTFILGISLLLELLIFRDEKSKYFAWSYLVYFLLISSVFIYHNTQDYFSLTIYWGILALIGVHIGIGKKTKIIRTIGMYLLIITLLKIVFYDIWNEVDNGIIRIVAFMFVGGLMIYISSLYNRHKLSVKDDLSFEIAYAKEDDSDIENEEKEDIKKFIINEKIKDIDISGIISIKFSLDNNTSFTVKSENLFRIVILVINKLGKTKFSKNELGRIYDYIIENYTSDLDKKDLDKLTGIIKNFVDIGGLVEINKK